MEKTTTLDSRFRGNDEHEFGGHVPLTSDVCTRDDVLAEMAVTECRRHLVSRDDFFGTTSPWRY